MYTCFYYLIYQINLNFASHFLYLDCLKFFLKFYFRIAGHDFVDIEVELKVWGFLLFLLVIGIGRDTQLICKTYTELKSLEKLNYVYYIIFILTGWVKVFLNSVISLQKRTKIFQWKLK
jgi:hypothetical protein